MWVLPFEGLLVLLSLWKIAFFETPFVLRHSVYSQFFLYISELTRSLWIMSLSFVSLVALVLKKLEWLELSLGTNALMTSCRWGTKAHSLWMRPTSSHWMQRRDHSSSKLDKSGCDASYGDPPPLSFFFFFCCHHLDIFGDVLNKLCRCLCRMELIWKLTNPPPKKDHEVEFLQ